MCENCINEPLSTFAFAPGYPCSNCDLGDCPNGTWSAKCIYYPGPPLLCIGAETNERLDTILQKIDARLCTLNPDAYASYNTSCLSPVANEKEFVEKISQQFCQLRSDFETFTLSTFPTTINEIEATITSLNAPLLTGCTQLSFIPTDTIKTSLQKISNAVCDIYNNQLSVSGVSWNLCSVVPTPPTTIVSGFNFLLNQICNINSQIGTGTTLPTFDNTGTCLPSPTASDSLVATIVKMRGKLCTAPSFDINALTWNCVTKPSTVTTDLQSAFQALMTKVDVLSQNLPTFDPSDFATVQADPLQPCAGKTISLQSPIVSSDRFVAVDNADSAPGTLSQKLQPGTGMSFDTTTTPGVMIVNNTSSIDEKVKTSGTDPISGYLEDKITGSSNSLLTLVASTVANQVQIAGTISIPNLVDDILTELETNPELKARFCALAASCPSPCQAPSNITVTYVP